MTKTVSSVTVDLPYPHKFLWPNGTPLSKRAKNVEFQKHKAWAFNATWAALGGAKPDLPEGKIRVRIHATRKAAGVYPDEDNVVAAMKAYLDGIALKLGINDRRFSAPLLSFGPKLDGRFVITIGSVEP